jgi:hypothetical protein
MIPRARLLLGVSRGFATHRPASKKLGTALSLDHVSNCSVPVTRVGTMSD